MLLYLSLSLENKKFKLLHIFQYKAPTYPYGEAPYPQQPPYQSVQQTDSPVHQQQGQPG